MVLVVEVEEPMLMLVVCELLSVLGVAASKAMLPLPVRFIVVTYCDSHEPYQRL